MIFGVPATAALIFIITLALRRTRRLYVESAGRQAAEEALKQAQRLEALGQLTGGVAHDFNNLLMVIGGSVERLKSRPGEPHAARSLSMIEAAVRKGASLTKQLLSFSRRQSLSPRVIDVIACVKEFGEVLQQSLRGDILLHFDLPDTPLPVRVDKNEFEIALLNLTLNARDAMPNGGTIRIGVAPRNGENNASSPEAHFVAITVTDTGHGIADEIRDRVFEPYFTTKTLDKGTGLGLSQVYGFAGQSEGTLSFETTLGIGTTFTILLPRSEAPILAEPPAPMVAPAEKPLRVLLVEDNADVAVVAREYLERCGSAVIDAASAEAAIELLNTSPGIDLVFSDIVMPGMNGLELARLIREHHRGIAIILASGYSEKASAALAEGFLLLSKPYSLDELRSALSRASYADANAA